MFSLSDTVERARQKAARVVFPEWEAPRIVEARARLEGEGICTPVSPDEADADALAQTLIETRGVKAGIAGRMLARPMIKGAALVQAGLADVMVAGVETPTRRVIEGASLAIGLEDDVAVASSFSLMLFPDGTPMIFADCAVNVAPNAEELAAIARTSVNSATALLGEARAALLSFSTGSSGSGESVDLVAKAAELSGLTGPIQADAALSPAIAARKGLGAGDANVLIFPSLDAGNIAYKLCQELAGAQALGPFLQGFKKPVCDLSRGASVDDIVLATALTVARL